MTYYERVRIRGRNELPKSTTWDDEILNNLICKLNIEIDDSLIYRIKEDIKNMNWNNIISFKVIDLWDFWPHTDSFNELKEVFKVFDEDKRSNLIVYCEPYQIIRPHVDKKRRGVTVYIPLLPEIKDYSPVECYFNNKIYVFPSLVERSKVYVWNPQIPHSVFNNEYHRYNLQLSLNMSYYEFREKYKDTII